MRKFVLAVFLASAGLAPASAQAGPNDELAKEIHAAVMDKFAEYRNKQSMKVMTGCFEWGRTTYPPFTLYQAFYMYTAAGSDGQIFPGKLRRGAMQLCEGWRAKEHAPCQCQVVDDSGKNVLEAPDDAILWIPPQENNNLQNLKRFSD